MTINQEDRGASQKKREDSWRSALVGLLGVLYLLMGAGDVHAKDICVNNQTGQDQNAGTAKSIVIAKGVNVVFDKCTFKDMEFKLDAAANVQVADCTLDAKPLTSAR